MVLDTCFVIDLMRETARGINGPAVQKISDLQNAEIYISMFTICELRAGAAMSKNPKAELKKIENMAEYMGILYPDSSFPVLYGEVEALLRSKGQPIPVMDLLIGISAKTAGQSVLTLDVEHFGRIPGLNVVSY